MVELRMKRIKRLLVCASFLGVMLSCAVTGYAYTSNTRILPAYDAEVSDGSILVGVAGEYVTEAQVALNRINEIRLEACKEGVWNPSNPNIKLTEEDYVPIKWSASLEKIARIRAAEASLVIGHTRPNGTSCFSLSADDVFDSGEVLAWNYSSSMTRGIEQWYDEKQDWVQQNGDAVTGHYTAMIDPENTYVGLGCMLSSNGFYYNTTCGRFGGYAQGADTAMESAIKDCIQMIEILRTDLGSAFLAEASGNDNVSLSSGETRSYECMVHISQGSYGPSALLMDVTWTSSNPSVAVVDSYGKVTGVGSGTATIKAVSSSGLEASVTLTVKVKVSSVSLPSSKQVVAGKTVTLKPVVGPANAADKSVSWSSSNKNVATVSSSGKVTAKKPGKAVITAKAKDGSGKKAACMIIVKPKKMSAPSLSVVNGSKLKVSWKKQSAVSGYQIQYGIKKNFKGAAIKKVGSGKKKVTLTGLKKKKTYYVRIRAYKKVDGTNYYGAWSSKKKLKIK